MKSDLLEKAFDAAIRMSEDRGLGLDRDALRAAVRAVAGEADGQEDPVEVAEDALELLGKSPGAGPFPARRRPF